MQAAAKTLERTEGVEEAAPRQITSDSNEMMSRNDQAIIGKI